jgi:hypothetical protein
MGKLNFRLIPRPSKLQSLEFDLVNADQQMMARLALEASGNLSLPTAFDDLFPGI